MSTGTLRLLWEGGQLYRAEDSRHFSFPVSGDPAVAGAKPSDLLPLSLAACLAYDVVVVLAKKRQRLDSLTVSLTATQADTAPLQFLAIELLFELTGVIEAAAADRALELALKNCPVRASLSPDVDVVTSIVVR